MKLQTIMFTTLCTGVLYFNIVACAIAGTDNGNRIPRSFDAKAMLTSLAGSLMSRGYAGLTTGTGDSTSQVISLNITNLVVLVLLKALIFAAGSLGAGTWKGGLARSSDGEETLLSDEEILLYLSYLVGKPGSNACLQNIACQQPLQARRYAVAGDMLLKTAKTLSLNPSKNYEEVLQDLQEAANWGTVRGDCSRYRCGLENIQQTN